MPLLSSRELAKSALARSGQRGVAIVAGLNRLVDDTMSSLPGPAGDAWDFIQQRFCGGPMKVMARQRESTAQRAAQ